MKTLMMSLVAMLLLVGMALPALSCATTAASLCGVRQFTRPSQYMSVAGYLRWQEYQTHTAWLPWKDAVKMAKAQLNTCPPVTRMAKR